MSRSLIIGNDHSLIASDSPKDANRHEWTMFVDDSEFRDANACRVTRVVYRLHPTFKPSAIAVAASDTNPRFELRKVGWGTFVVNVEVEWDDGVCDYANHELSFSGSGASSVHAFKRPRAPKPPSAKPVSTGRTASRSPARGGPAAGTDAPKQPSATTPPATTTSAGSALPPINTKPATPPPQQPPRKADDDDEDDDEGMGEQEMSDPDPRPTVPAALPPPPPSLTREEAALWHGYLLANGVADLSLLPKPECVTPSDDFARPDYTKIKSAEYMDAPEVLEMKADLLIKMWTSAQHPLIYAGAGISVSSGIWDYASNAKGSIVQPKRRPLTMDFIRSLKPTPAHRVITAMERRGYVWGWLQQNHDGLAQKAGFPSTKTNELHGAWLDQKGNPIIKMSGTLRGDLFDWCVAMEEGADFVFAIGTSMSGLNSDRVAATCSQRHIRKRQGQGLAIISIQQTPYDNVAALRIFARIDDFMMIVARKMDLLPLDTKVYEYKPAPLPVGVPDEAAWQAERAERIKRAAAVAPSAPASKTSPAPPRR